MSKPLHTVIEQQIDDYISEKVTITDQYQFSQYDTIQQIENFMHSRFTSGQTDARGNPKPFFNITKGKVNIAIRATDIDRKDITIKETTSDDYFRSFVASKMNHQLMNKMRLQDYLNEWGEDLPQYGSVVTKIVEKSKDISISVMDWHNFICDPVSFDAAPKIETLTFSPAELRQHTEWDQDAIEELIEAKQHARKNLKGEIVYQDASFITVYEVHGLLPLAYLKTDPKAADWKKYSQQMHVIAWHVNDKNEREDFTLFSGKEKKDPYTISHWKKAKGRTLGVGVVEDMFQPQIWHNYGAKKTKDQLDLASTTIFQTSDGNLAARNVLTNLQNGDFIIHAANQAITPVNVQPQGVQGWQTWMESTQAIGSALTSTPDAISGDTMPSGTAFRQVAMLNTEAHSYFDYITENKANYLEFLYREFFIPFIVKQLDNTDEIVAILDSHEIEFLDNEVANIAITEELKTQTLAGAIVSPIQLDQLRAQKLQDLKKTGAKRYLNPGSSTWKTYFKDFEWNADINISGESEDKKTTIDTLFNALQTIAQNPGILQNPTTKMLFMRLLEASDVISPIEIDAAAAAQPTPQPQQPQAQPQPGGNTQNVSPQLMSQLIAQAKGQLLITNHNNAKRCTTGPIYGHRSRATKNVVSRPRQPQALPEVSSRPSIDQGQIDQVKDLWSAASVRELLIKCTVPVITGDEPVGVGYDFLNNIPLAETNYEYVIRRTELFVAAVYYPMNRIDGLDNVKKSSTGTGKWLTASVLAKWKTPPRTRLDTAENTDRVLTELCIKQNVEGILVGLNAIITMPVETDEERAARLAADSTA